MRKRSVSAPMMVAAVLSGMKYGHVYPLYLSEASIMLVRWPNLMKSWKSRAMVWPGVSGLVLEEMEGCRLILDS